MKVFLFACRAVQRNPKNINSIYSKTLQNMSVKTEHRPFMQNIIIKLATSQLCVDKHMIFLTSVDRQCNNGFSETDKKRLSWIT